jgi:antirestriction protein ArdC
MNNKAKELVDSALDELRAQLEAGKSEMLLAFLDCMSRFHRYSWSNVMLIDQQKPDATHVAGFHKWREMNRWVRKGESGIAILAPMMRRKKDVERDQHDDEKSITGFRTVHVFDVSQTEGEPLPDLAKPAGDAGCSLAQLEQLVRRSDIGLVYESIRGGADGYSAHGRIGIEQSLPELERFAVLAHELAHEWLDHHEQASSKKLQETEAEAVAYVVGRAHGIEMPGSSDYIQLYRGDARLLGESLGRIQKVAARILEGMTQSDAVTRVAA